MLDLLRFFQRTPRHSRRRRAAVTFGEALESRTLLAGNVAATLNDGILTLQGDLEDNSVEITVEGEDLVVRGLDDTMINDSADDFVIEEGAATFSGDVFSNLGFGDDTLAVNGPLTIEGDVHAFNIAGADQFAITDATIEGNVDFLSSWSADKVSFVEANIEGHLWLDLGNGRNFVSLLDSMVDGHMKVHTGNRNDVLLLDNTTVGGLHAITGNWRDDIILRGSTIDGDFHAHTGADKDFILMEDSNVTGDTQLWMWGDSDVIVTQGTNEFSGDFLAGGILGRRDTIELSDDTTIDGESHILFFENESLADLTRINERIGRRLAEALDCQVILNGVELGELTLTVDTSSNTDAVQSNGTLVTTADTFTIEGMTLPRSTVDVTAGGQRGDRPGQHNGRRKRQLLHHGRPAVRPDDSHGDVDRYYRPYGHRRVQSARR